MSDITLPAPFLDEPFLDEPVIVKGFEIAIAAGGEGRLVGGVVRDALLGRPLGDYDMAVTVPIGEFAAAARAAKIRVIETGLAHGSISLHYKGVTLEVTQTRTDIETDGRHAVIGFTPSFYEDAKRRDFTINALYVDSSGLVHDPLGGMADLTARVVRFIGQAEARITEDYLRILRFFRFASQLENFYPDAQNLADISAHFDGLSQVSGERIVTELRKLFQGANWPDVAQMMRQVGLDQSLFEEKFLPLLTHYDRLDSWHGAAASCLTARAVQAFLALPHSRSDSAQIRRLHSALTDAEFSALQGDGWREVVHFGGADFYQRCLIQQRYHSPELSQSRLDELRHFTPPPCPVTGHDLQQAGMRAGPEMGEMLREAERLFIRSDYKMTALQIIEKLQRQTT